MLSLRAGLGLHRQPIAITNYLNKPATFLVRKRGCVCVILRYPRVPPVNVNCQEAFKARYNIIDIKLRVRRVVFSNDLTLISLYFPRFPTLV